MRTKSVTMFSLLIFVVVGRPNANMVLTPELDSYSQILADWKEQDNVASSGYSQAIGQILSGFPDNVATPFNEEKQTLAAGSPTEDEWEDLYIRVCSKRRGIRLEPYLDHLQSIVYCSHSTPGEVFRNIGGSPAGKLRAFEINGLFGEQRQIYHGSKSCRTPDVSYDGKRILFSARTGKAAWRITVE